MSEIIIQTQNLTKNYGDFCAVDNLNLEIFKGEVFGILGPNGAGKTTTILMLLGLTEPSSGSVRVAGFNPVKEPLKVKRTVGFLPDRVGFYDNLTGRENLRYSAELNGLGLKEAETRIEQLLQHVGLGHAADKETRTYSRGMNQRLGLAEVLIKDPEIIIMDEPTLGIDPEGAQEMLTMIEELSKKQNKTILLSSHLLHQVQQVCDRVGIFVKGRIIAQGPVETLYNQLASEDEYVIELKIKEESPEVVEYIENIPGVIEIQKRRGMYLVHCKEDIRSEIASTIQEKGFALLHLHLQGYSLDDIYRRYFQQQEVGYNA